MRPYHVIKKNGLWHVYVGNDAAPLCMHPTRAGAINQARSRSRRSGGRVIVHRANDEEVRMLSPPGAAEHS